MYLCLFIHNTCMIAYCFSFGPPRCFSVLLVDDEEEEFPEDALSNHTDMVDNEPVVNEARRQFMRCACIFNVSRSASCVGFVTSAFTSTSPDDKFGSRQTLLLFFCDFMAYNAIYLHAVFPVKNHLISHSVEYTEDFWMLPNCYIYSCLNVYY